MDSVPEYEIGGIDISGVTTMDDLQAGIQAETGINDIDLSNQRQELSRNLNSHDDVQSVIDYYTDNDGYPADSGLGYSDYQLESYDAEITNLTARSESATEKKMKRTGGITVMEEQVTSWTLLNATRFLERRKPWERLNLSRNEEVDRH